MKITHLSPSPKAGQTEHLPPHRAQTLIDAGFAVAVPLPARGSNEWLLAMNEQEAERLKLIPADQRQTLQQNPTWTVRFLDHAHKFVVVMNHLTSEVIYGESIQLVNGRLDYKFAERQLVATLKQAGCPQSVIQKYLDSKNAPDFLAQEQARIEADKRAAVSQRERERNAPKFI